MGRLARVVFAVLLAVPAVARQKKATTLPFTTNPDGVVIVPVVLGGAIHTDVFLDTGAGLDGLAPSIIEKLHGKPAGAFTAFRLGGERLDLPLFIIPELRIGPIVKRNALVGAWDVFDQWHFAGVISMSDFRQEAFTLDFPNKQIIFETSRSLRDRLKSGAPVPLTFDDERGIMLDLFVEVLIGGQAGQCEMDTGTPDSAFSSRYMEPLGISKDGKDVTKQASGAYLTTVPQIALAADPSIRQMQPKVEFGGIIYDCVLGVHFWSGRSVTVDIPNKRLIVSRAGTQQSG
ncbi:MAG TPA: hypothetical protein VEO19_16870 [Terriglobia bacterium]|nr:hypothetical protein [Terriglobia bacterium]